MARLWAYAGETTLAPAMISALFTFAAPLTLAAAVATAAGTTIGAIAGILLLGTPRFVTAGASQFADIPVAALLVTGLGALIGGDRVNERQRFRALVLGGFLLGLTGWTKNDGLAAAAVVVVTHSLLGWRGRGLVMALRDLGSIVLGAALPATAWLAFHATILPSIIPELTTQSHAALGEKIVDSRRWALVLHEMVRRLPGFSLGLPAVVIILAVSLGARPRALFRSSAFLAAVVLYLVYVGVFMMTPQPLVWHLGTAAWRLALQP